LDVYVDIYMYVYLSKFFVCTCASARVGFASHALKFRLRTKLTKCTVESESVSGLLFARMNV
jgi:hypothetical protein